MKYRLSDDMSKCVLISKMKLTDFVLMKFWRNTSYECSQLIYLGTIKFVSCTQRLIMMLEIETLCWQKQSSYCTVSPNITNYCKYPTITGNEICVPVIAMARVVASVECQSIPSSITTYHIVLDCRGSSQADLYQWQFHRSRTVEHSTESAY